MADSSLALGAYAAVFAPLEAQGAAPMRSRDGWARRSRSDCSPTGARSPRRATSPTGSGWRR